MLEDYQLMTNMQPKVKTVPWRLTFPLYPKISSSVSKNQPLPVLNSIFIRIQNTHTSHLKRTILIKTLSSVKAVSWVKICIVLNLIQDYSHILFSHQHCIFYHFSWLQFLNGSSLQHFHMGTDYTLSRTSLHLVVLISNHQIQTRLQLIYLCL